MITADKWMDHSTLAVVNGKHGPELGITWRKFMDAFMNVFPEKAKAQMISSFDELRSAHSMSEMAAFIPEYLMAVHRGYRPDGEEEQQTDPGSPAFHQGDSNKLRQAHTQEAPHTGTHVRIPSIPPGGEGRSGHGIG